MLWLRQSIDNVEVMPIGLYHRFGRAAKASPDISEQGILAQKFRALRAAHPTQQSLRIHWVQQSRTLTDCLCRVEAEGVVHSRTHDGTQIVEARYGDYAGNPVQCHVG